MRCLVIGVCLFGCGLGCGSHPVTHDQSLPPSDLSATVADLATSPDLASAVTVDLATPDLAIVDLGPADQAMKLACGEPQMQCCIGDNGKPWCNPATAMCNAFGVCVACGSYPMKCCPGGSCRADQTCLSDPTTGDFCYPCGHAGQDCCFSGPACVEAGTTCITPDGGVPICSH